MILPTLVPNRHLYRALMNLGQVPLAALVQWAATHYSTDCHENPAQAAQDASVAIAAHLAVRSY